MSGNLFITFGLIASVVSSLPLEIDSTRTLNDLIPAIRPRHPRASWQPSSIPSSAPSWTPSSRASQVPSARTSCTPSSAASWAPSTVASQVSSAVATSSPPPAVHTTSPHQPNTIDKYILYSGDGTTAQGWPDQSEWKDFDTLWTNNQALIAGSCTQFGQKNNSPQETADMLTAIRSVSSSTKVDPRFILAIILQESKGCVRVPTTQVSVPNPGLMQDYDGTATCNNMGRVLDPCPQEQITQMIIDGTAGTHGPGLVQDLESADTSDVCRYYKAARIYNSGSIPFDGNLVGPGATPCYASDIANRLMGWVNSPSQCS